MPTLPARLQPTGQSSKNGEFSIYTTSGQIIHPVEQCCIQNKLLGLHSWKVQGYICPWESSCSIFTSHQMEKMIYMPDEIILARTMTALDLEFEKVLCDVIDSSNIDKYMNKIMNDMNHPYIFSLLPCILVYKVHDFEFCHA